MVCIACQSMVEAAPQKKTLLGYMTYFTASQAMQGHVAGKYWLYSFLFAFNWIKLDLSSSWDLFYIHSKIYLWVGQFYFFYDTSLNVVVQNTTLLELLRGLLSRVKAGKQVKELAIKRWILKRNVLIKNLRDYFSWSGFLSRETSILSRKLMMSC